MKKSLLSSQEHSKKESDEILISSPFNVEHSVHIRVDINSESGLAVSSELDFFFFFFLSHY